MTVKSRKASKSLIKATFSYQNAIKRVRAELRKLRRLEANGYCAPYGRIAELERFVTTKGQSHGYC
ncbi:MULTISPECIES: hypothetical protein [unclassified Bradyrhizobium]|uniref:hypothetical protein n=1 Tax=unclassified Bradyrhizobium TaxID=2631580 RepID=UPI0028E23317|nr:MULTISPECIES: hypothetical protein [unclassified Bradyrhizobium]